LFLETVKVKQHADGTPLTTKYIFDTSTEFAKEGQEFSAKMTVMVNALRSSAVPIAAKVKENHDHELLSFKKAIDNYDNLTILKEKIDELIENRSIEMSPTLKRLSDTKLTSSAKRFRDETNSIVKRTSEFLSAAGINHSVVMRDNYHSLFLSETFYIVISREGSHYVNKLAKDLYEDRASSSRHPHGYKTDIVIDPARLLSEKAAGLYSSGQGHQIILKPDLILEDSIIRNYISFHEFVHRYNAQLLANGNVMPFHAEIFPKEINLATKDNLGIYSKYLSVDELVAYRASLRILIYEAIKNKHSATQLASTLKTLDTTLERQINLTTTVNKVFAKLAAKEKKDPINTANKSSIEIEVDGNTFTVKKQPKLKAEEVLDFSDFNLQLYDLIQTKLQDVSSKSNEEKITALRQIGRVLSLRSVRKHDREYPILEEILVMLNENPGN